MKFMFSMPGTRLLLALAAALIALTIGFAAAWPSDENRHAQRVEIIDSESVQHEPERESSTREIRISSATTTVQGATVSFEATSTGSETIFADTQKLQTTPAEAPYGCNDESRRSALYHDSTRQALRIERELREAGDIRAEILHEIACEPLAVWLMGEHGIDQTRKKIADVISVTDITDAVPVFVLYNRPTHGYAGWESGLTHEAYITWIRAVADELGMHDAWIVLEPDALATAGSYDAWHKATRAAELGEAVSILSRNKNIRVYIDVGHSHWLSAVDAGELLRMANVKAARGFSLNVANYRYTADEIAYGRTIADSLSGAHFIVDTGRNGKGPHPDALWCNAPNRALGERPEIVTDDQHLDAYLWVKPPGESDGTCNGGPPAGKFWLEYALELVQNT